MRYEIGRGILSWLLGERRSGRYGTVVLCEQNYAETVRCERQLDEEVVRRLVGKRGSLVAEVLESRPSGHVGDFFHVVFPSQPEVGERVVLGVGHFFSEESECGRQVGVSPEDGRVDLWLDINALYRVHDQTVRLLLEVVQERADRFTTASPCATAQVCNEKGRPGNGAAFMLSETRTEVLGMVMATAYRGDG
ncbi:MAG: hypothetical protein Q7T01_03420 [bacterium]|nr:hypothetical protein [bacterium]